MRDWHRYWNTAGQVFEPDPLRQVGKTVMGVPVGGDVVALIARTIAERLALLPSSHVLELCCGNGVITRQLVGYCGMIDAVDFSVPLIESAKQNFPHPRIAYWQGDVMRLPAPLGATRFDAIVMQEALQHFSPEQLAGLLAVLGRMASAGAPLYFGSVPDAMKLRAFYDTAERHEEYLRRRDDGTEPVGTWWSRDGFSEIARRAGYAVEFFAQPREFHTAHYRFDAVLRRSA